jgi:hypothetical protein
MSNVTRIYKDGEVQQIEKTQLKRFLELGWSETNDGSNKTKIKSPAKKETRKKVSATAQVTSIKPEDEEEEWDIFSGEDWADSVESVSAPEGERLSDLDSKPEEEK